MSFFRVTRLGTDNRRSENDIGKATSRIGAVKEAFKEGFVRLSEASPNDYRLGLVVGIKQSVVDHRAHIKQLTDAQISQSNNPRRQRYQRNQHNDNQYHRDDEYSREQQRGYGYGLKGGRGNDRRPYRGRGGFSQG